MKLYTVVFYISLVMEPLMMRVVADDGRIHYTAITDDIQLYLYRLYLAESNSNPPLTSLDFAAADPKVRLQICEEISRSGVFSTYKKTSVDMDEVYEELMQPQYSHLFKRIYRTAESPGTSQILHEYDNPYKSEGVEIHTQFIPSRRMSRTYRQSEHVFVCLLRKVDDGGLFTSTNSDEENIISDEDFNRISVHYEDVGDEFIGADDSGWETWQENTAEDIDHRENVGRGSDRPESSNSDPSHGTDEFLNELLRSNAGDNIYDEDVYTTDTGSSDDFHRMLETLIESAAENITAVNIYSDTEDDDENEENLWGVLVDNDDSQSDASTNDIIPFYVSKLYNPRGGSGAHRFVFTKERQGTIMLAEGSAKINSKPDFNVELHYLELRKHHEPVTTCEDDPVCKLKNARKLTRLCSIVLTSSFFKDRVAYPFEGEQDMWSTREVSFRTEEGLAEAAGRSYSEIMVRCHARVVNEWTIQTFEISRAYRPNEVFVYSPQCPNGTGDDQWYLENLSTNISIVNERYNFDNVEI